jgi:CMP-N-acetylneuraminic acid synthetase
MKVLSVIFARAGSKGVRNKCVSKINGKMVAEYSIEYSLALGNNVKTVVSTDIDSLIDYCKNNNIEYIRRDSEFCKDEVPLDGAVADAIERTGANYEYFNLVYGNIATRYTSLFYEALNFLEEYKDYDAAISMQNVEKYNPMWMFDYNKTILPEGHKCQYRRQDLPQKMIHDGHTFLFRIDKFINRYRHTNPYKFVHMYSIYGDKFKPLINNEVIVDIDTEKDLKLAESVILHS